MNENFVALPADGDGKKLRTLSKVISGNDVHQEIITLADAQSNILNSTNVNATYALLVHDSIEYNKEKVNVYNSQSIATGATITVSTYTVPVGKKFVFTGATIGGDESGEFLLEVNGSDVALIRNSGSMRTINHKFVEPPEANAGQIVNIKVKNIGRRTTQYETSLCGYIIDM